MKKLLLLSLLFSALVFQSCKKLSSNIIDEDLPIIFSQAVITKATTPLNGNLEALVLGSEKSNDWTTIYGSAGKAEAPYAKGMIILNGTFDAEGSANNGNPTNSFYPQVLYPITDAPVYIKALVGDIDEIKDVENSDIINSESQTGTSTVTFTIDGKTDIMATKGIVERTEANTHADTHGVGNRDNMRVNLIFDHLLSKIDFHVQAESPNAQKYWGDFVSVTFLLGHTKLVYDLASHTIGLPVNVSGPKSNFTLVLPSNVSSMLIPLKADVSADAEGNVGYACSAYVFPSKADPVGGALVAVDATTDTWEIKVTTKKTINGTEQNIIHNVPQFNKKLEKGRQYKVVLDFKDNTEIGFTVTTTAWTDPDPATNDGVTI